MAEASNGFRRRIEAVVEADGNVFTKIGCTCTSVHILSKFGMSTLKIYFFIAFLLKNCERGENTAHPVQASPVFFTP